MKLFQNKFFLVCLIIALVICAVTSTFAVMGYQGLAKNILGTVTTPFRWTFQRIADGFEGIGRYFTFKSVLIEQNDALKEENEKMAAQQDRLSLLEEENKRLRTYLNMKTEYPSFTLEEGMIISSESANYLTVFTLNRGTLHGVNVNMPVITEAGIVGCVTEVGLNWCKVTTVLETASKVGAYTARTGDTGIVNGDYSLRYDGLCKMTYIKEDADIAVGDVVLSSGNGSVYPSGLVIGKVVEVGVDKNSRTIVATVAPSVDFSDLKWMLIVTGYEKTENPTGGGAVADPDGDSSGDSEENTDSTGEDPQGPDPNTGGFG